MFKNLDTPLAHRFRGMMARDLEDPGSSIKTVMKGFWVGKAKVKQGYLYDV